MTAKSCASCSANSGYKTNHHTIKHFLRRFVPVQLELNLWPFRLRMPIRPAGLSSGCGTKDGTNRALLAVSRWLVRMCMQSLRPLSRMGLKVSRTGGPPLSPSRPVGAPVSTQRGVGFATGVPAGGRFRLHGLLEHQYGPDLPSASTVGRSHGDQSACARTPGPWRSARDEQETASEPRHLPYRPHYRHRLADLWMPAISSRSRGAGSATFVFLKATHA